MISMLQRADKDQTATTPIPTQDPAGSKMMEAIISAGAVALSDLKEDGIIAGEKSSSDPSNAKGAESSGIPFIPAIVLWDALFNSSSAIFADAPPPTTFATAASPTENLSPERISRVKRAVTEAPTTTTTTMTLVTGGSLGFESVGDDGSRTTGLPLDWYTTRVDPTGTLTIVTKGGYSLPTPTSSFTGCYDRKGHWNSHPNRCDGMGCEYHGGWNGNLNYCRNEGKAIVSTARLDRRDEPTAAPTEPKPAEAVPTLSPTTAPDAAPTSSRPHHGGCKDPNGRWHSNEKHCRGFTCKDEAGRWHHNPRFYAPHGKLPGDPVGPAAVAATVGEIPPETTFDPIAVDGGVGIDDGLLEELPLPGDELCIGITCIAEQQIEKERKQREQEAQEVNFDCGGMPCPTDPNEPLPEGVTGPIIY